MHLLDDLDVLVYLLNRGKDWQLLWSLLQIPLSFSWMNPRVVSLLAYCRINQPDLQNQSGKQLLNILWLMQVGRTVVKLKIPYTFALAQSCILRPPGSCQTWKMYLIAFGQSRAERPLVQSLFLLLFWPQSGCPTASVSQIEILILPSHCSVFDAYKSSTPVTVFKQMRNTVGCLKSYSTSVLVWSELWYSAVSDRPISLKLDMGHFRMTGLCRFGCQSSCNRYEDCAQHCRHWKDN